jgi:integrase
MGTLTARKAETVGPGRYHDGDGLYLEVTPGGSRSWIYRYQLKGKRQHMGLGSWDGGIRLAEAREARDEARKLVRRGIDPIEARDAARSAAARPVRSIPTFGEAADLFMKTKGANWSEATLTLWKRGLEKYAAPIRSIPVDELTTEDVLGVLEPLWKSTNKTARDLRARIEAVMDAAKARGQVPRDRMNPAEWRGNLKHLLPDFTNDVKHHDSLPYERVPELMALLKARGTPGALALMFVILTGVRTKEALHAKVDEFDLDAAIWTIPGDRMKMRKPHRVPLSPVALAIAEKMIKQTRSDWVFYGRIPGKPLSPASLLKVLAHLGWKDGVTGHGFRSSFRTWADEQTSFPVEAKEMALAHTVGDATQQAYARSDLLEQRRELMEAWAVFCIDATAAEPVKRRRR